MFEETDLPKSSDLSQGPTLENSRQDPQSGLFTLEPRPFTFALSPPNPFDSFTPYILKPGVVAATIDSAVPWQFGTQYIKNPENCTCHSIHQLY